MTTTTSALLRQLTTLDPAADQPDSADRPDSEGVFSASERAEATRLWVLSHDRADVSDSAPVPPRPRVRARRIAIVGVAAVGVLALIGIIPGMLPGAQAPAAAIPMLTFEAPTGTPAGASLADIARTVRSLPAAEPGTYYFSHGHRVSYSMVEAEVSPGRWEVESLRLREEDTYYWLDTRDDSGGGVGIFTGEDPQRYDFAAGAVTRGVSGIDDGPQGFLDAFAANNSSHREFPGHYLISDYTADFGQFSNEQRATYLETIALAGDVTSYGATTTRNDLDGVAFGATRTVTDPDGTSTTIEVITVLDPATGAVLEEDTMFPNELPGAPSQVEEYLLILDSGFYDTLPPCGPVACQSSSQE